MAPRTNWKGFVQLSLVSVPVKAYTANESGAQIRLNQLHSDCNSRIAYKKVCPEHGEVSNDQIIRGYEHAKGKYVVIDDDELDKLRTKSDRCVNIEGFVAPDELDPIYHAGRTYYLLPDGPVGQKPYRLLVRGMEENGVNAVAQVVISQREQLVLLRPLEGILAMTVLNHQAKVKSSGIFREEIADAECSAEELQLASTLINASRLEEFDYGKYTDRYVEKLSELIRLKVEGAEVVQTPDTEAPQIINLMEALKESVAAAQGAAADAGGKKQAPSATARRQDESEAAAEDKRKAG
ncbi:MAG: Ku protein [Spirochaetaceae bacterium]|nr:Ku protein [Spirochaetaceae bacterium]